MDRVIGVGRVGLPGHLPMRATAHTSQGIAYHRHSPAFDQGKRGLRQTNWSLIGHGLPVWVPVRMVGPLVGHFSSLITFYPSSHTAHRELTSEEAFVSVGGFPFALERVGLRVHVNRFGSYNLLLF